MQQQTSPLAAPSAFLPVLVLEVFSTDWLGFDRHRLEVSPPSPPLPLPLLWLTSASCCCHSISSHPISPQGYGHLVLPVAVPVPVPVPGGGAPGNAEAAAGRPDGQYHCDGMPAPRSRSRTRTGRDVLVPTWRPRGQHGSVLSPYPQPYPHAHAPLLSSPILSSLALPSCPLCVCRRDPVPDGGVLPGEQSAPAGPAVRRAAGRGRGRGGRIRSQQVRGAGRVGRTHPGQVSTSTRYIHAYIQHDLTGPDRTRLLGFSVWWRTSAWRIPIGTGTGTGGWTRTGRPATPRRSAPSTTS